MMQGYRAQTRTDEIAMDVEDAVAETLYAEIREGRPTTPPFTQIHPDTGRAVQVAYVTLDEHDRIAWPQLADYRSVRVVYIENRIKAIAF